MLLRPPPFSKTVLRMWLTIYDDNLFLSALAVVTLIFLRYLSYERIKLS